MTNEMTTARNGQPNPSLGPLRNRGLAFSLEDRKRRGRVGRLPPAVGPAGLGVMLTSRADLPSFVKGEPS